MEQRKARARLKVVLVGGAGLVGTALHKELSAEDVTVVDPGVTRDHVAGRGARHIALDICSAPERDLTAAFAGADALVHLVAQLNPPSNKARAAMRRLHVRGTERVFAAAQRAGVKQAVLVSSAVVYGARSGQHPLYTEAMPAQPNADFPYAVDKAAQEEIAQRFADAMTLCIVRPAIIYGRGAKSFLTEIIRRAPGIMPAINGARPLQDFVHVTDVAGAIVHLLQQGASGVFNIPSAAPMSLDEVAREAGLRTLALPRRLISPVLDVGARFVPAHLRAPSYILDYLTYPFVMDGAKLSAAGYTPKVTSHEALAEMLGR